MATGRRACAGVRVPACVCVGRGGPAQAAGCPAGRRSAAHAAWGAGPPQVPLTWTDTDCLTARLYASLMVASSVHVSPVTLMAVVSMLKVAPAPAVRVALSPSGMAAPAQPSPVMAQVAGPQPSAGQV